MKRRASELASVDSPFLGMSQRMPPSNIQAEQALLGAILANNHAYERVCDFLRPEHFIDPANGSIYRRIGERLVEGRLADAVTLHSDFQGSGMLAELGGTDYLAQLLGAMVGILNAGEYGREIVDKWQRRQLVEFGMAVVESAFAADPDHNADRQIEAAERMMAALRGGDSSGDRLLTVGQAVSAAIAQAEAIYRGGPSPALLTGLPTVDRAIGGLWPDDLNVLAGIPGAGKTALAVQIGDAVASRIYHAACMAGATPEEASKMPGVVIFELEMPAEQLGTRIAGYRAGISVEDLMNGRLDLMKATRLMQAERDTAFLPLRIHDCRSLTLPLAVAKVRMHLQRQPELLVIFDHVLALDEEPQKGGRDTGQNAANVGKATRALKKSARETGVPHLVLSHATRASAARTNPRPVQSDLKWAGEGDADTLVFVHRPSMFIDQSAPKKGGHESDEKFAKRRLEWFASKDRVKDMAELVVAKRRMGPAGVYRLRFRGETTSFEEWSAPVDADNDGYDDLVF